MSSFQVPEKSGRGASCPRAEALHSTSRAQASRRAMVSPLSGSYRRFPPTVRPEPATFRPDPGRVCPDSGKARPGTRRVRPKGRGVHPGPATVCPDAGAFCPEVGTVRNSGRAFRPFPRAFRRPGRSVRNSGRAARSLGRTVCPCGWIACVSGRIVCPLGRAARPSGRTGRPRGLRLAGEGRALWLCLVLPRILPESPCTLPGRSHGWRRDWRSHAPLSRGSGCAVGEGMGVRAYAPRISAINRRVFSMSSAAPAP